MQRQHSQSKPTRSVQDVLYRLASTLLEQVFRRFDRSKVSKIPMILENCTKGEHGKSGIQARVFYTLYRKILLNIILREQGETASGRRLKQFESWLYRELLEEVCDHYILETPVMCVPKNTHTTSAANALFHSFMDCILGSVLSSLTQRLDKSTALHNDRGASCSLASASLARPGRHVVGSSDAQDAMATNRPLEDTVDIGSTQRGSEDAESGRPRIIEELCAEFQWTPMYCTNS